MNLPKIHKSFAEQVEILKSRNMIIESEREIPFCDFQRAMTERAGYGYIVVISILLILGIDY